MDGDLPVDSCLSRHARQMPRGSRRSPRSTSSRSTTRKGPDTSGLALVTQLQIQEQLLCESLRQPTAEELENISATPSPLCSWPSRFNRCNSRYSSWSSPRDSDIIIRPYPSFIVEIRVNRNDFTRKRSSISSQIDQRFHRKEIRFETVVITGYPARRYW
jgi:hypothetical protein